MYTRDFTRGRRENVRYTPPPGYDGVAFDDSESTKRHEAEVEISDLARGRERRRDDMHDGTPSPMPDDSPNDSQHAAESSLVEVPDKPSHKDSRTIEELIRSLRGKIGTEELILILVILVVASEGIGIEVLLLGLLLIAG